MWRSENKRRGFLKTSAAGVSALALILKEAALGEAAVRTVEGRKQRSRRVRWDWLPPAGTPGSPINDQDHPWPKAENGDLRAYDPHLECEHVAFSIGHLQPGQSVGHHTHEQAEETYILMQGRSQIRIGETVVEAKAFDAFRFPADVPRSVYNHTQEDCWWVFIGTPPDEYYREGSLRDRARRNKLGESL